jgi:hypothetical protein
MTQLAQLEVPTSYPSASDVAQLVCANVLEVLPGAQDDIVDVSLTDNSWTHVSLLKQRHKHAPLQGMDVGYAE